MPEENIPENDNLESRMNASLNNNINPDTNTAELFEASNKLPPLKKSQKISAILLLIFSLVILVFWAIQFRNNLHEPFTYEDDGAAPVDTEQKEDDSTCNSPECIAKREAEQQNKDTDEDGLSDWDELNIYKTSPYLEDSDGDGVNDKEEIDKEEDPNCPQGTDCYNTEEAIDGAQNNTPNIGNPLMNTGLNNAGQTNLNNINQNDLNALMNQINGADGDTANLNNLLNQLSQESQNTNAGLPVQTQTQAQIPATPGSEEEKLQKLLTGQGDAGTLRTMLQSSGMDPNMLNQLSDDDLMDVYKQMTAN